MARFTKADRQAKLESDAELLPGYEAWLRALDRGEVPEVVVVGPIYAEGMLVTFVVALLGLKRPDGPFFRVATQDPETGQRSHWSPPMMLSGLPAAFLRHPLNQELKAELSRMMARR